MKTTGRKTMKGDKISAPKEVKSTVKSTAGKAPIAPKAAPTHDEISKRSYELYLERGGIDGYASEDWARAEAELQSR